MIVIYFKRKTPKVTYDEIKKLHKKTYYSLNTQIILTYNL